MAKAAIPAPMAGKRRWLLRRALSNGTELPAAVTSDPPPDMVEIQGRTEPRQGLRVSGTGISLCWAVASRPGGERPLLGAGSRTELEEPRSPLRGPVLGAFHGLRTRSGLPTVPAQGRKGLAGIARAASTAATRGCRDNAVSCSPTDTGDQ